MKIPILRGFRVGDDCVRVDSAGWGLPVSRRQRVSATPPAPPAADDRSGRTARLRLRRAHRSPTTWYGERHPFELAQIVEQLRLSDGRRRSGEAQRRRRRSPPERQGARRASGRLEPEQRRRGTAGFGDFRCHQARAHLEHALFRQPEHGSSYCHDPEASPRLGEHTTEILVWRAGIDKIEAAARAVDMPLRLDNANALPTDPQRMQKQQEAA
jgi:hypothetical protein